MPRSSWPSFVRKTEAVRLINRVDAVGDHVAPNEIERMIQRETAGKEAHKRVVGEVGRQRWHEIGRGVLEAIQRGVGCNDQPNIEKRNEEVEGKCPAQKHKVSRDSRAMPTLNTFHPAPPESIDVECVLYVAAPVPEASLEVQFSLHPARDILLCRLDRLRLVADHVQLRANVGPDSRFGALDNFLRVPDQLRVPASKEGGGGVKGSYEVSVEGLKTIFCIAGAGAGRRVAPNLEG